LENFGINNEAAQVFAHPAASNQSQPFKEVAMADFTGTPVRHQYQDGLSVDLPRETYRVVPGFPDYLISENGDVVRATFTGNRKGRPGDVIQSKIADNGYSRVNLWNEGVCSAFSIHRLVALAFLGTPHRITDEIRHLDGNKQNNHFTNLAWATRQENHADKVVHGTAQRGERNPNGKLTEQQVFEIKSRLPCNLSKLAREYGVSQPTISAIANGRTWKHVGVKELT
jgi:hypothetical protein